jgi:hypothetical protein
MGSAVGLFSLPVKYARKPSWMASGTRWSVRFECALPAVLLRVRDQIVERLIEVAESLADLIHPQSAFWTHEQGLEMHFEGYRIGYRVDLQQARIAVTELKRD